MINRRHWKVASLDVVDDILVVFHQIAPVNRVSRRHDQLVIECRSSLEQLDVVNSHVRDTLHDVIQRELGVLINI